MTSKNRTGDVQQGDILMVVHEFVARSTDELSLKKGDRIELIERDDDFGDGWYLGKHLTDGSTGLFPEVYTVPAPKPTLTTGLTNARGDQIPPLEPSASTQSLTAPSIANSETSQPSNYSSSAQSLPRDGTTTPTNEVASPEPPKPLQPSGSNGLNRTSSINTKPRSLSLPLGGDLSSPVMAEALSVIDEHITDMNTPRHSAAGANDSGSDYSNHIGKRQSYVNGSETDEEESTLHTESEVLSWTPMQVATYLEHVGVQQKHCDIFREQEINGEALLGMDQTTIFLKEFELGPVGPRLRTWLKIKALQQEVKTGGSLKKASHQQSTAEDASDEKNRTKSMSTGPVLPRIPTLRESAPVPVSPSRQQTPRVMSTPASPPPPSMEPSQVSAAATTLVPDSQQSVEQSTSLSATPPQPHFMHSKKPSAASIRSMNHNRRHSSIDVTHELGGPVPPKMRHSKQASFDRGWTMSSAAPRSADLLSGFDTDGSQVGSPDYDRGYFSGNEVDNRRTRNVLRKRESDSHSRTPSYTTDSSRRVGPRRHSRFGSADTARDSVHISPAARAYYSQGQRGLHTSDSTTSPTKSSMYRDSPPTVTKLDFANSPSIDAIAASPNVANSDTSSIDKPSPSPGTAGHSFFSKKTSRATGLRAISDAITGSEKALLHGDGQPSPVKDSPLQSPIRSGTGSSTPSAAGSRSFEYDEKDGKQSTSTSKATPGQKRRTKKTTSAYLRGLEQKSPQEQIVGCDYSGWMKKKSSNLMATWKTRLFVLRGRRLSYYYSENDTEEKGLIDISNHRVLPANNEFTTMVHAAITGATASPSSPHNASIPTSAAADEKTDVTTSMEDAKGMFIFKLVPPRSGLPRGVNFTKPTIHYFAVDNIVQGRLWMAALIKATIDRDPDGEFTSSYAHKTISLAKARGMKPKPYFIRDDDDAGSTGTDRGTGTETPDPKNPSATNSTTNGTINTTNVTNNDDDNRPATSVTDHSITSVSSELAGLRIGGLIRTGTKSSTHTNGEKQVDSAQASSGRESEDKAAAEKLTRTRSPSSPPATFQMHM